MPRCRPDKDGREAAAPPSTSAPAAAEPDLTLGLKLEAVEMGISREATTPPLDAAAVVEAVCSPCVELGTGVESTATAVPAAAAPVAAVGRESSGKMCIATDHGRCAGERETWERETRLNM